jgi:hypothetical protein
LVLKLKLLLVKLKLLLKFPLIELLLLKLLLLLRLPLLLRPELVKLPEFCLLIGTTRSGGGRKTRIAFSGERAIPGRTIRPASRIRAAAKASRSRRAVRRMNSPVKLEALISFTASTKSEMLRHQPFPVPSVPPPRGFFPWG